MRFRSLAAGPSVFVVLSAAVLAVFGCSGASAGAPEPGRDAAAAVAASEAPPAPEPEQPAGSPTPSAGQQGAAVEAPASDGSSVAPGPAVTARRAPLPTGTKVLHVGDSFAGALGLPLAKLLEAEGVHSILKHTDASYLTGWAWDNELRDYLWKFNPDLVLVTLGANELAIVEPQQRERAIKKIVATIGDRPCVWVAIPLWNGPQNGLLEVIRGASAPCRYLDTNQLMDTAHMARIHDGIHPTQAAREAWAQVVLEWLSRERDENGRLPWSMRPNPSPSPAP